MNLPGVRWALVVSDAACTRIAESVSNSPQQKFRIDTGCAARGTATIYHDAILRQVQTVMRPDVVFTGCKAVAQTVRQVRTLVSWHNFLKLYKVLYPPVVCCSV